MAGDIASLGFKIDTSDVAKADAALDGLTEKGKKAEDAAKRVGSAWEKAAGKISGDTGEIVRQLQALNKTQTDTASVIARIAASMASFSKAAEKTNTSVDSLGAGSTNAASKLDTVSAATAAVAETAEQATARLTAMARASLEASEYYQRLKVGAAGATTAIQETGAAAASSASLQRKLKADSDALAGTQNKAAASAKATSESLKAQGDSLQRLLGQIDPVTAALDRLDAQEQELIRHKNSKLIDLDTFNDYKSKIDASRLSLARFDDDIRKSGTSAKQTSSALRQLPAQFSDIAISLQGGQNPLSVFLQQGSQIKDSFGGAGPALKATAGYISALINPFTLAAAAAVTLAVAYKQGSDEATAYNTALVMTGNASGATASSLTNSARAVSQVVGTIGAASQVLTQLAASGKIPADSFDMIAVAALKMEKATGTATAETVANFVKLAQDPVKASKDLNDQLNYLTTTVYAQIDALQRQGDTAGAAALAESAYADALVQRADKIKDNLGYVESAWNAVKEAASGAWDAILDVGREDTLDQKLSKLENRLKDLSTRAATPIVFDDNPNLGQLGGGQDQVQKEIQQTLQAFQDETEAARKAEFAVADNKAGIAAVESLNKSLDDTASKQDKLKKRYAEIDQLVKTASSQGKAYSQQQIDQLRKAAEEQYKETPTRKVRTKATPAYQDDAATKLLQSLREQESSLEAQLSTSENLTAAQKARVQFEQQIADLKTKDILTADQKSLVANQDAIKAQLDKNVAIAEEVRLHGDSLKLQERGAQIQATIASANQNAADRAQDLVNGQGKGSKQRGRDQETANTTREFQRYQDQLNKATPASQLGSDEYVKQTAAIKEQLDIRLKDQKSAYDELDRMQADWSVGASEAFQNYIDDAKNIAATSAKIVTDLMEGVTDGISNSIASALVQGDDLRQSLSNVAQTIETQLIASLIKLGIQYAVNAVIAQTVGASTTAASAALAASTAVAWAPAAALVSLASFGANSIPAAAGLISTAAVSEGIALTSLGGFREGGYTGNGGSTEVAGLVHKGEYVMDAQATARIGVENLRRLQKSEISGVTPAANYAAAAANSSGASGDSSSSSNQRPVTVQMYNTFPGVSDSKEAKKSTAQAARQAGRAIQNLQRFS